MALSVSLATDVAIADVALAFVAAAGLVASRMMKPASVPDMAGAFSLLERAIQKFMPDMPVGYTWPEAIERLKGAGVDANWDAIQRRLNEYEEIWYGGGASPQGGKDEVVSLVLKVRGLSIGKRAKR